MNDVTAKLAEAQRLAAPVAQAEPVTWPSAAEIADEIDALLPMSLGDSTMATIEEWWRQMVERKLSKIAAPVAQAEPRKALTDAEIERGREATFSTGNPFCPCDSKTMRKAVRWAEAAHNIKEQP